MYKNYNIIYRLFIFVPFVVMFSFHPSLRHRSAWGLSTFWMGF